LIGVRVEDNPALTRTTFEKQRKVSERSDNTPELCVLLQATGSVAKEYKRVSCERPRC
jgi:hypothetical protein